MLKVTYCNTVLFCRAKVKANKTVLPKVPTTWAKLQQDGFPPCYSNLVSGSPFLGSFFICIFGAYFNKKQKVFLTIIFT